MKKQDKHTTNTQQSTLRKQVDFEPVVSVENLDIEKAKRIVHKEYPRIWISCFAQNRKSTKIFYEAHYDNMCNILIPGRGENFITLTDGG